MREWVINSDQSLENFINQITHEFEQKKWINLKWSNGQQRTATQNKAVHVYCELLAEALNDAGLDMRVMLKDEIDIPWTKETVKQHLWKPVQLAVTGKESTTKLDRTEVAKVYDVMNRHLGEKKGISVDFPCKKD